MKSVFTLVAALVLSASFSAAADFGLRPGGPRGPGGPGAWNGGVDLCNADYQGSWSGRPLHISVTRSWRNQVNVVISQRGTSENLRGTCDYGFDGSANLQFRGRFNDGNLGISPDGFISGFISNYSFQGRMIGNFPGPGPGPGPTPNPGPNYGHCYGTIQGTWGYKGGRAMTLTVQRGSGEQVVVLVSQGNGGEAVNGICRPQWDGSAQVEFSGGANSGNITIDVGNRVSGIVSGFSFTGHKQ